VVARRGDTMSVPLVRGGRFAVVNPALSPDGRWLAYASNEALGRFEVFVRPFPNVDAYRVQVSQGGGTAPRWAHSGRELFFRNGAGALVSAAALPTATFTLGRQAVLFDGRQFYESLDARSYDVAPGDQRFLFMQRVIPTEPADQPPMDKLVQITNWGAEVREKLAGNGQK
jgi:eukaryotic-like serine/threonine-protein kinase